MSYTYISTYDVQVTYSEWGPWSPLEEEPDTPYFQSCRTRQVTKTWRSREVTVNDAPVCPGGYVLQGSECLYWTLAYPFAGITGTLGHPSTVAPTMEYAYEYGPEEQHEKTWEEKQCKRLVVYGHNVPVNALAYLPHPIHWWLPRLVLRQGDAMEFTRDEGPFSVMVNGSAIDPARTIVADDYEPGAYFVDIDGEIDKTPVRFQLVVDIIPRLRFAVGSPITSVNVGGGAEEVDLYARLANQSSAAQLVRLNVSAPQGWQAHIVDEPLVLVEPGEEISVTAEAQAQLGDSSLSGTENQLLPFIFQATVLGEHESLATATIYAQR